MAAGRDGEEGAHRRSPLTREDPLVDVTAAEAGLETLGKEGGHSSGLSCAPLPTEVITEWPLPAAAAAAKDCKCAAWAAEAMDWAANFSMRRLLSDR